MKKNLAVLLIAGMPLISYAKTIEIIDNTKEGMRISFHASQCIDGDIKIGKISNFEPRDNCPQGAPTLSIYASSKNARPAIDWYGYIIKFFKPTDNLPFNWLCLPYNNSKIYTTYCYIHGYEGEMDYRAKADDSLLYFEDK